MVAGSRPQNSRSHRARRAQAVGRGLNTSRGKSMRIAVVHDYFTQMGGAEKVAAALMGMLPGAALHATVALPECMPADLAGVPLTTSWMQKLPGMRQYYRFYFLLYPMAVPSLDLSGYDLVLSSSSGYAKGVRTNRDAIHVCYCHTPMRWAWNFDSYSEREEMGTAKRFLLSHVIRGLRRWDVGASRQPDHFIANSQTVAARIRRAYGRIAEVIHPPIDLGRFRPSDEQDDYYVVLARLVSYKRIDLAVRACTQLGGGCWSLGMGRIAHGSWPMRAQPSPFSGGSPMGKWSIMLHAAGHSYSPGKRTLVWRPLRLPPPAGRPLPIVQEGQSRPS